MESFRLFCALETQWRVAVGLGGSAYIGIDYTAAEAVMRMRRVKDRAAALDDLRSMEAAVLPILNKHDDDDGSH